MSLDITTFEPLGDKKNSDFFNEYRLKIYERRRRSGIEELLDKICALVVQVETNAIIMETCSTDWSSLYISGKAPCGYHDTLSMY